MIRNLFGGSTKCRTIDKLDIFGDGSGVALYRLDGNANDESGNYHGTETAITYGGGVYERGAVFNGSSSYISTAIPISQVHTISAWIKKGTNVNTTASAGIVTSGVNSGYGMYYQRSADSLIWLTNSSTYTTYSLSSFTDNEFIFVCMVYNVSNSAQLYINGNLVKTDTVYNETVNYAYVGKRYWNTNNYYYGGSIDQVRIFNRAITAQEVATLYAECEPTSIVDNINPFEDGSLKALYKFDNDATDATGVYNGTATNVTYASGKFGNCAVFNGSSSKVLLTLPSLVSAITVSCWVKFDSLTGDRQIFDFRTNAMCQIALISNSFYFRVTTSSINRDIVVSLAGSGVTTGVWNLFTLTFNKLLSIGYINGKEVGRVDTSNADMTPTAAVNVIGTAYSQNMMWLFGSIDQLRIFNKALTPLEVASLYNETTPMEEPMSVQVDPFKDGSGKALYRLEGNALDESGNYNGTPTSVTYGSGRFGSGAVFNGSSSWLQTLPLSAINYSSGFTFSCWVKTATNDSTLDAIVCQGNDGNVTEGFNIANYLGNVQFQVYQKSTTYNFPTSISNNTWRHIVLSIASSGYVAYVDGNIVGTITNASSVTTGSINPTPLNVGCHYGVNNRTNYFNGSIDQVRIFNKALTQTEVTALYNEI